MKGGKKKSGGEEGEEGEGEGSVASQPLPNDDDENARNTQPVCMNNINGDEREDEAAEAEGDGEVEEEQDEDAVDADEEEEEEEEAEEDQKHLYQDQPDAEAERPKLDDGFYEIEAVRRKRVRKGEVQYLIKWRGWPETANTWEPLENLQSCSDVIDAFEEGLRLGKHRSSRRRKRKYGGPHTQPKKKQQHFAAAATDNVRPVKRRIIDQPLPAAASVNNLSFADDPTPSQHNIETTNQVNEHGPLATGNSETQEKKEDNELNTTLNELKGTVSTDGVNTDKLAIHFQEAKASEGDGLADGLPKVDGAETTQTNRCTGAKRRKSGSVKRFKQDPASCEPNDSQDATARIASGSCGRVEPLGVGFVGDDSGHKNKFDDARNASVITEIIKPISYSASVSNSVQDVLVTFMATRSDGKEVMVDNKFLKANNPLLLINFYEQHLRYSPTP
ncbi:hypothetical protein L1049_018113 [Liquidambar formosana]|uniref:Chromo domain-containing protein n=1 Tax=Liquidambar formosana TaxID=63359 RepID=A0AAP0NK91_LIQFO